MFQKDCFLQSFYVLNIIVAIWLFQKDGIMKILIDCDETLLENTANIKKFYLETIDASADIDCSKYCSRWAVWKRPEEWEKALDVYTKSDYFSNIPPVTGAIEAVKKFKQAGHRLSIITSCGQDRKVQENRRKNIRDVFGEGVFEDIIFLPLGWGNKKEALEVARADLLIDDSIHNCRDALLCGMQAVLLRHPNNSYLVDNVLSGISFVAGMPGQQKMDNFDIIRDIGIIADNWPDAVAKLKDILK